MLRTGSLPVLESSMAGILNPAGLALFDLLELLPEAGVIGQLHHLCFHCLSVGMHVYIAIPSFPSFCVIQKYRDYGANHLSSAGVWE